MIRLDRLTICMLASGALALAMWAQLAFAQSGTTQNAAATGQNSAQTQTTMGQNNNTINTNTNKEVTVTGCLSGPNNDGMYTLINKRLKNGINVNSAQGLDLKDHVGQEVKLAGTWTSGGAAIAEKEKPGEKADRLFQATKIQQIAAACTTNAKMSK